MINNSQQFKRWCGELSRMFSFQLIIISGTLMRLDNCMINYSFPWLVDSQSQGTHCAVGDELFFVYRLIRKTFDNLINKLKVASGKTRFHKKVARSFAKFVTKTKHLFRFHENIFFWQFHEIGFLRIFLRLTVTPCLPVMRLLLRLI